MKMLVLVGLFCIGGFQVCLAWDAPMHSDTTKPKPRHTDRRPVQMILPGLSLDTSFSSITKPDSAVYTIVPKWLRGKAAGRPIYVIDGFTAKPNQLAGLKPSAVEAVQVIDGQRAVSLYGSVARGGVVLITTKAALLPRQ